MDLVYICRDGDNEELKYSIRSAVANLPHDNIWVVGGKPDWYTGKYLAAPQTGSKDVNIKNNMLFAISSPEVSESFILMNDDFFIIKEIDHVENYYDGYLHNKANKLLNDQRGNPYADKVNKTFLYLAKLLKTTNILNYDTHVPMIVEKEKLFNVLKHPGLPRSIYGNLYAIGGKQLKDVKFFKTDNDIDINDLIYVSTEDNGFNLLYEKVLKDMFPYPSQYECP